MKRTCLLAVLVGLLFSCSPKLQPTGARQSQTGNKYKVLTVAFYNLENLFDTINDPTKQDEKSPIMQMKPSMRGKVYWQKISHMAKVISQIGAKTAKQPPAIIGVSEVENRAVIEDLVNDPHLKKYNYGIVHYESPDWRGIDVALLYRKRLFHVISSSHHPVVIYSLDNPDERRYTRDVLEVDGTLDGDTLHVLVNHWPSRYGGEKRSLPHRMKAAAVDRHIVDSLQAVNPYAKVLIMGDLNDDPTSPSVKKGLDTKSERKNVGAHDLYNPMEDMLVKQGLGTLGYRDSWNLFDQIIMTKPLLSHDYDSYRYYKAAIFNPNYLITQHGRYKGYPYRSFVGNHWTGGYSDHFPVYILLVKKVQN